MSEPRRLKGIAKGRKRKKEDPFPLSIDGSGAAHIFSIARFSACFPCRRSQVNDTPPSRRRRAAVFAAPRGRAKGDHSQRKNGPPYTPQDRKGCALDLPLPAPAGTMLSTLRKELPSMLVAAFDLVCSLPPLPLCGAVSDKTHVSFRTRSAAAAERSKEHTKSSEAHAPPYRSRKVSFSPAVRGSRGLPLVVSWGSKGDILFN